MTMANVIIYTPQFQHSSFVPASPLKLRSIAPKHSLPLRIRFFPPPLPSLSVRCFSSRQSDMDATAAQSLYPLHRCKTLHLVRHAQGTHNVAGEKEHSAYLSYDFFDAKITPLGWEQVDNLRNHVHACGLSKRVELVIVSPLLRTMETAVGVFGGEGYKDGINVPPLMVKNAGGSNHSAISSLNCPPFLAVELCRERLGVNPCDKRRSISEYRPLFPAIDFSLIESDDDNLWVAEVRETNEEVAARGLKFLNWIWSRKEKEIGIVTHSAFLFHALSAFGNDCHPSVKSEICKQFANCELRSVVIVDRGMMGSDSSTTNYSGTVPRGLDHPSNIASEKYTEKMTAKDDHTGNIGFRVSAGGGAEGSSPTGTHFYRSKQRRISPQIQRTVEKSRIKYYALKVSLSMKLLSLSVALQ